MFKPIPRAWGTRLLRLRGPPEEPRVVPFATCVAAHTATMTLKAGLNVYRGRITHAVAAALGVEVADPRQLLAR